MPLKGKLVKLIPMEKKYLITLFNWENDISIKYLINENSKILTQKEFKKKFFEKTNNNIFLLIMALKNNEIIGFINGIGYNKIDRYIYTNGFIKDINENKEMFNESALLFYKYIFDNFNVRKIYSELYSYNIQYAKTLRELGFKKELKLEDYKFFNGKYHSKYVLSLDKETFLDDRSKI